MSTTDRHAPLMNMKTRGINQPWLTSEITSAIRDRNAQLKKARKSNCEQDWQIYKYMRNRVTNLIRKSKSTYNQRLIERNSNSPKSFWKIVKRILPNVIKDQSSCIMVDGNLEFDPKTIAKSFNDYFCETIRRLSQSLNSVVSGISSNTLHNLTAFISHTKPIFQFEAITEQFTRNYLQNLKPGKSSGLDNMPAKLMKESADIIAGPLTKILNLSLSYGRFPSEWKSARIVPLLKSGKSEVMDNYRPISILPIASKILEKAVHTQLYSFLTSNNLLSPYQFGFRKRNSTETASICLIDTIRRNMDQGRLTGAVFVDFSKAFDTIDHDKLLLKLKALGIHGTELNWFTNYLCDRLQAVHYQNALSEPIDVVSGVPQGSILGPLLFVIFVNEMPSTVSRCNVMMYADDTVLFFSSKNVEEIEVVLNQELNTLYAWLSENSLFLNKKKTEFIIFGTSVRLSNARECDVKIGDNSIKRVSSFRYLGVVLDEALNWNAHLNYIITKGSKRLGLLKRVREDITLNAADVMYRCLIRPIFDYSDSVWTCCNKTDADLLERLQRRAARIVYKSTHSDIALERLRWPTLVERRDMHVYKLVNKCLDGNVPQFLTDYFTFNRDRVSRRTRQSNLLYAPKVKLEAAKKSFYYNGCIVFNKLSNITDA